MALSINGDLISVASQWSVNFISVITIYTLKKQNQAKTCAGKKLPRIILLFDESRCNYPDQMM